MPPELWDDLLFSVGAVLTAVGGLVTAIVLGIKARSEARAAKNAAKDAQKAAVSTAATVQTEFGAQGSLTAAVNRLEGTASSILQLVSGLDARDLAMEKRLTAEAELRAAEITRVDARIDRRKEETAALDARVRYLEQKEMK